jgi:hypothetical protein
MDRIKEGDRFRVPGKRKRTGNGKRKTNGFSFTETRHPAPFLYPDNLSPFMFEFSSYVELLPPGGLR